MQHYRWTLTHAELEAWCIIYRFLDQFGTNPVHGSSGRAASKRNLDKTSWPCSLFHFAFWGLCHFYFISERGERWKTAARTTKSSGMFGFLLKWGDGDVISVVFFFCFFLTELWSEGARGVFLFFQLWSRLWGRVVNLLLCQGAYLRRLLSHHTFVALWAWVRGRALRTSQWDAALTGFLTPA